METQPPELILKQIDLMEYKDILNLCSTSSAINRICRENKEYIYRRLLQRDWGYTSSKSDCSKNVYRLIYETYIWNNYTLGPFDIYGAITNLDFDRVQRLLDMGFRETHRNAKMSPLQHALSFQDSSIIRLLLDNMITTTRIKVTIPEMTSYITSKTLSSDDKIRLINRFKRVVNTSEFLKTISEHYYDPKLKSVMQHIKGIIKPSLVDVMIPVGSTIVSTIQLGDYRTLDTILQSQNFTTEDLQSGLILAINESNVPIIEKLQRHGADLNYANGIPLKRAIDYSKTETVMYLIMNGARINTPNFSILKRILKRGRLDLLEYFLKNGSLDNIPVDVLKQTFLILTRSARLELIRLLESRGFRNPLSHAI